MSRPPGPAAGVAPTVADADPSATPAEVEHFGAIARQLTKSRREILQIIDVDGPIGLADLVASERGARTASRATHLVTGLLWKLETLGWVTDTDGRYSITGEGRLVLRP